MHSINALYSVGHGTSIETEMAPKCYLGNGGMVRTRQHSNRRPCASRVEPAMDTLTRASGVR